VILPMAAAFSMWPISRRNQSERNKLLAAGSQITPIPIQFN